MKKPIKYAMYKLWDFNRGDYAYKLIRQIGSQETATYEDWQGDLLWATRTAKYVGIKVPETEDEDASR